MGGKRNYKFPNSAASLEFTVLCVIYYKSIGIYEKNLYNTAEKRLKPEIIKCLYDLQRLSRYMTVETL